MRLSTGNESHSVSGNGGKKISSGIMTLIHAQLWLRLNRVRGSGRGRDVASDKKTKNRAATELIYLIVFFPQCALVEPATLSLSHVYVFFSSG